MVQLDIPDRTLNDPPTHVIEAHKKLKETFEGQNIILFQTMEPDRGRQNRMGHHLAHIVRSQDKIWAQGLLLTNGLARVRTTRENYELAYEMLQSEEKARQKSTGIWSQPQYRVLTPETATNAMNSYQIVKGQVEGVAVVRNTLYLNFGQNWRRDFTVSLPASLRKELQAAGFYPLKWKGRIIRARGWIESYNGPYMEIDHIERLEIVDTLDNEADETSETGMKSPSEMKTLSNRGSDHKLNILPVTRNNDEKNSSD